MDQIALGKRIKAARERAGMTQEELAAAVDYSVDHMSVVERGVKAPKLDKLVAIANVLKVGTDELLQDIRVIGVADGLKLHTGSYEPLQLGKAFESDRLSLLF